MELIQMAFNAKNFLNVFVRTKLKIEKLIQTNYLVKIPSLYMEKDMQICNIFLINLTTFSLLVLCILRS